MCGVKFEASGLRCEVCVAHTSLLTPYSSHLTPYAAHSLVYTSHPTLCIAQLSLYKTFHISYVCLLMCEV